MNHLSRFEPPSLKQRGQVAQAMAAVQERKPAHGECSGTIPCTCGGGRVSFTIQASGISRGSCNRARCWVRWVK